MKLWKPISYMKNLFLVLVNVFIFEKDYSQSKNMRSLLFQTDEGYFSTVKSSSIRRKTF